MRTIRRFGQIILSLLLVAGPMTYGQEVKHSLDASLGALSTNYIHTALDNSELKFSSVYQDWDSDNEKPIVLINSRYLYGVSKRFRLGASFSYEHIRSTLYIEQFPSQKVSTRCYTLGFEFLYRYLKSYAFEMYATAAPALVFRTDTFEGSLPGIENGSTRYLNFHVTPFGFRFGHHWGGFFELGLGSKGLIHGGISYHFTHPKHSQQED